MGIDLQPDQRRLILDLLEQQLGPEVKVYAFGSRVRGDARPFSDLDLLISSSRPISYAQLAEVCELLSESDLPFAVDLLDAARISSQFRQRIQPELVMLRK